MKVLFLYRLTVLPNMISFLILHQFQKLSIIDYLDNFEFENYFNIMEDKDIYTLCKF
jgi:hypothetical protein